MCGKYGLIALVCHHHFNQVYQVELTFALPFMTILSPSLFVGLRAYTIIYPSFVPVGDHVWHPNSGVTYHVSSNLANLLIYSKTVILRNLLLMMEHV